MRLNHTFLFLLFFLITSFKSVTDFSEFTIKHPEWTKDAVIYEVNIRQYTPEGTFNAFAESLPRLKKMGIKILWLMPIHPIGEQNRKGSLGSYYSVKDYYGINPDLGTRDDFKNLVERIHAEGMYVILDWVPNHTSWDNAMAAEHPDYYKKNTEGNFMPPVADWQDVIALDYNNPDLQQYMENVMFYWVNEMNIDGFRADVAGFIPSDFWNKTRARLEKVKPVFMLAEWDELWPPTFIPKEQFNPDTKLMEKAFDMSYALQLHNRMQNIAKGTGKLKDIDSYLEMERKKYPKDVYYMNFTSSHDINSWEGTEFTRYGKGAKLQAVFAALMPGMPMIYSGQEAASNKVLRFFDKDTIQWGDYVYQQFYTELFQLKIKNNALWNGNAGGDFTKIKTTDDNKVYAFSRKKDNKEVIVMLNFSGKTQTIKIIDTNKKETFFELFNKKKSLINSKTDYILPAYGYLVYHREE